MTAHRQKCHDGRLFITAAAPSTPASQEFAQVRAGYSYTFKSRGPHSEPEKSPSVTQTDTQPPCPAPATLTATTPPRPLTGPPDPNNPSHSKGPPENPWGGRPTTTRSTS